MARSKSTSGSKASRTSKEQTGVTNPGTPDAAGPAAPEVTSQAEVKPAAEVKQEPRKLGVVKGESRKNVVPINLEDEIRRRAYELYQQRETGTGNEAEDWLTAEREVRQRYRQQSA